MNKLFLFSCIFLVSCSTLRFSSSSLDSLKNESFGSISQPFSVKYCAEIVVKGKANKIEGTIKVNEKKDVYINGFSSIYGIEVFKIVLTGDSIVFIDKLNKTYFTGLIDSMRNLKVVGIDKVDLLNLLFGKKGLVDKRNYNIKSNMSNPLEFTVLDTVSKLENKIFLDNKNFVIRQFFKDSNGSLDAEYNSFSKRFDLPQVLKMKGEIRGYNVFVDLKYSEFKSIKSESFVLKIPSKFSELK